MLLEKMSVQPHFELFITTVAAFLENKMPDKVLVQWQKITQSLIGDQNKEYLDFLQTTAVLFSKKILYQGGSSIYSVDTLDFDMSYKGEIVFTFNNVTLTCKGVTDKMEVKASLKGHKDRVIYLSVGPDGEKIVTGAGDETIRFWDVFTNPSKNDEDESSLEIKKLNLR